EKLGLPYLSAYLDAVASNFTHGANFATAGSTIRPQNTSKSQGGFSPVSSNVQWYQFAEFITRLARALYTFDIGQNDLAAGYYNNMSTAHAKESVPDVLDQLSTIIKQHKLIMWLCHTLQRKVRLKEMVVQLRIDLPSAAITYVDVYKVKYLLISQAKKHGFEHPLRACCGHGGKYNYNPRHGCGSKVVVYGTEILLGKSCRNPMAKINWDGVHYTEAGNKFDFEQIVDGAYSDLPIPLHMACQRVSSGS
ncbi:hypothetical protein MKX01_001526, partial [Papaver californicum]